MPEIRFVGFSGDWEVRKLGDVVFDVSGNDGRTELPVLTMSAGNGWMNQKDRFSQVIAGNELKNYTLLKNGELSYNHGNSKLAKYGVVFELKDYDEALVPRVYHSFKSNNNSNPAFLECLFSSKIPDKELGKLVTSGARMDGLLNISKQAFFGIKISSPDVKEQTQIGNFFRQLDDTIALHQQELTTLQQTKQGFLQKMFPKEGESVPEVRFSEFNENWREKELKEISVLITKGTTPADKSWEGPVKYIKTDSINPINGNIGNTSRISKKEHENNLKRSKLKVNDILFSIVGTLGRVGIVKEKDLPANTNQQICIIRLSEGDTNFIFMALKTPLIEKFIESDATIGAQPSISLWQMEGLKVPYPSREEQTKIGTFFKQLDDLIALHQRELDALQKTKKAFLQKMFV